MVEWTFDDVQRLRIEYLAGKPLKEIARHLKRSPSAINKAISRFKLRHQRHLILPLESSNEKILSEQTSNNPILKAPPLSTPSTSPSKKKLLPRLEKWVPFDVIIEYLENLGYVIGLLDDNNAGQYWVNGRILSPLQMIMTANKIRLEHQKLPFKVEEITQ